MEKGKRLVSLDWAMKRLLRSKSNFGILEGFLTELIYKKENDSFLFNPIDSTLLENGDYIIAIGYSIFIKEFEQHLKTRLSNA